MTETLPIRYCHGCDQFDDHPRFRHMPEADAAADKLYHYDCVPTDVRAQHPESQPGFDAADNGKRGQDVRDVMVAHAASITEAPADTKEA